MFNSFRWFNLHAGDIVVVPLGMIAFDLVTIASNLFGGVSCCQATGKLVGGPSASILLCIFQVTKDARGITARSNAYDNSLGYSFKLIASEIEDEDRSDVIHALQLRCVHWEH